MIKEVKHLENKIYKVDELFGALLYNEKTSSWTYLEEYDEGVSVRSFLTAINVWFFFKKEKPKETEEIASQSLLKGCIRHLFERS